jgi:Xaa-Pro aminopeptidase
MSRINKLEKKLQVIDEQSLLIFSQYNITYLTGFNGHAATVLITATDNYLITDYRYFEQAKKQASTFNVICRNRAKQSIESLIKELLTKHEIQSVAFEADHISFNAWQQLSHHLNLKKTTAVSRLVEDLRYYKDKTEIQNITAAAAIADQALANILPLIKPGVTEREMAIELEYQMSQLGSEELSFATIFLSGKRSALPHGSPGNTKINKGDLILCDFGAMVNGYHSDMTRTYVVGKPDSKQKEIFNLVSSAQQAAIDAIEEGVTGEYLAQHSHKILDASPYALFKGEGLGHGVGLELHEYPIMGKGCTLKISQGCVITIEPGIYIPEWGGIRIEDDVVLTEAGLKIINTAPKEFIEL